MYNCKYCGKECKNVNSLKNHERRCHSNPDCNNQDYECKYCNRIFHQKSALHNHERHCKQNSDRQPQAHYERKIDNQIGICKYCGKFCKNQNSLRNHERLCKSNPNAQKNPMSGRSRPDKKGCIPWNKGLTKETDERIQLAALKISEGYSSGRLVSINKGTHLSIEQKEHLSTVAKNNHYEKHFGKRKIFEYNGLRFISSYEVDVAKSLDENNIRWIQPKRFPYKDLNGKLHYYTPDLYLPDYDIYLDPKNDFLIEHENPQFGYKDVDKIKWVEEYNNIKVLILNKDQLDWTMIKKLIEEYK